MKRILALALLLAAPLWAAAADEYTEGENFRLLGAPLPTQVEASQVEVVEFFWYGCPHCYDFEPYVKAWLKEKSENVVFKRVPAIFRPSWKIHAQAYYTAELLGVLDTLHPALMDAMHKEKRNLADKASMREFFIEQGVTEKAFDDTFGSFLVMSQVARAEQLTRRSGIRGVPSMIIAGRYQPSATSYNDMIRITDFLAQRQLAKADAGSAD